MHITPRIERKKIYGGGIGSPMGWVEKRDCLTKKMHGGALLTFLSSVGFS